LTGGRRDGPVPASGGLFDGDGGRSAVSVLTRGPAVAAVIGPFPWDPFPPEEPEPKGPDPLLGLAFRSAVSAADAYRSVRLALRRESGTLRIGNRFVPDGRYREVAFLSFGDAASSMALAALHVLGDRLTQGFIAGPEAVPPELPFHSVTIQPGWGGDPAAAQAIEAAREIAGGLSEQDLLLVLLSPGALRALLLPPARVPAEEFGTWLARAHEQGATGREVGLLARVLGDGAVGGRLAGWVARADAATFVVDRGDGPRGVGGGPMQPIAPAESEEARATLQRIGLAIPGGRPLTSATAPAALPARIARPTLVAEPSDALRAAADAFFDKGWTSRLAFLELRHDPETSADQFLARAEEIVRTEGLEASSRARGVAAFSMMTLGLPEGIDEGPGLARFLLRVQDRLRRREMSVGLFRTAGVIGSGEYPAGGVVGPPTASGASWARGRAREIPMRAGITDVGLLAVGLFPAPASPAPSKG